MVRQRQIKILSIVALVVAIAGMTLGFAAFSTTLSISSSATVTPNSDDFKIVVYGAKDEESSNKIDYEFDDSILSSSFGYASITGDATSSVATIDNINHTISNINIEFTSDDHQNITYDFYIRNEGKYAAYLDVSDFQFEPLSYMKYPVPSCTAGEGATLSMVENACNLGLYSFVAISSEEFDENYNPSNFVKIPVNESIWLRLYYIYSVNENTIVDGPFTAEYDDIKLEFSSVPPTES